MKMNQERALRGIAGVVLIISLALTYFHSPLWMLFTLFVALNLLQSSLTNWCPMMWILDKMGVKRCGRTEAAEAA